MPPKATTMIQAPVKSNPWSKPPRDSGSAKAKYQRRARGDRGERRAARDVGPTVFSSAGEIRSRIRRVRFRGFRMLHATI